MNFIKIIILGIALFFLAQPVYATESTLDGEEPLPLNDPFAGDDASGSTIVSETSTDSETVTLRRYKLVAAFSGSINEYATFVNETGEFITLELQEELTEGLKLVEINIKEAVFQKADNGYISLNFKNQIRERDEF